MRRQGVELGHAHQTIFLQKKCQTLGGGKCENWPPEL